ncbi:hypothetical protein EK21DRAFT_103527 [Setomelanomma holmii]|uniref:Uncharacterized protein n=1 Tax=Setomelanomma holmii TaxID=210430 RepID=A0A9P4LIY1_9PLEO|nr:hypothetical protein EK21DRAFT_103527 [Setomelanomma holmii]
MDYYQCSTGDLYLEIRRRRSIPFGTRDQLSEALHEDDEYRGADATTIKTEPLGLFVPRQLNLSHTSEFGQTVPANLLVNERIIYWQMNTFFPSLQLFFASGRSCTIDGGQLSGGIVGLDPHLRFRLTDCTNEEEGLLTKSLRPDKFASTNRGIKIKEAVIAQRTSIVTKLPRPAPNAPPPKFCAATIDREIHTVVGLRLEGMKQTAFIWAKAKIPSFESDRNWGDVRIAGLRNDVPAPVLTFPLHTMKPGSQTKVVVMNSLISRSMASIG